jgi:acyl-CoA:acyl-CoA alkyltransferase
MLSFRFNNVCIESYSFEIPPYEVSSAEIEDKLAPLYNKLGVPFGTLEKLSGIQTRCFFENDDSPSQIATRAAKTALDGIGFDRDLVKTVFSCSVTRDFFEPATAVLVHNNLGFSEEVMAMDITNACIGFSNGLVLLANLIETGVVKAGLIVSGEQMGPLTDTTIELLLNDDSISRAQFMGMLATFTLGSGGTAMVLCHDSIATKRHRVLGSVSRSASEFHELCIGNADFCFHQNKDHLKPLMETESRTLLAAAAKLGNRTWKETSEWLGWSVDDIDHIFCHQVGKHVNEDFYKTMELPIEKEHTVYERYGNLVSAAMPSALISGANEGVLSKGEKVLLTAFGSGLNAIFTGVEW